MLSKKNVNLLVNTFLYLFFVILIVFLILRHFNYELGQVLYTGDLRIHKYFPAENTDTLFNFRMMFETTPFLSLYPVFSILKFLNIEQIYFFILFVVPILAFISMDFVLRKYLPNNFYIKGVNLNVIISTSLSFVYIMNPSYFNRIGHWNINFLYIFIPLFFFLSDEFLKKRGGFHKLLLLSPIIFYGVSSPHAMVGFSGILVLLIIINFERSIRYVLKSISILIVHGYAISHNILAMFLKGNVILKTSWEGETNHAVLTSLSKNSSLISALSGTNYYYDLLISHPAIIGSGFIAFIIILILTIKSKKFTTEDTKFLSLIVIFLFINLGYKTTSFWFDSLLLNTMVVKDLLWLIKDSNIFYNFLIFFIITYLAKRLAYQNKYIVLTLVFTLLFTNIYQLTFSNIDGYLKFFDPIKIPNEYVNLSNFLSQESKRTLWIPSKVYVNNSLAPEITYFPNPNLWLTRNPEITIGNSKYQEFINILKNEIVVKKCQNKELISWLVKSNDIYLVLDKNSDPEEVNSYNKCLLSIPLFKKIYQANSIDIFTSEQILEDSTDLIKFIGSIDQLNEYIKSNPSNLISFEEKEIDSPVIMVDQKTQLEKVFVPYHPSLTYNNQDIVSSVNFISSVFIKDNSNINYSLDFKNNSTFKNYIRLQSTINLVFVFIFLLVTVSGFFKKNEKSKL